MTNWLNKILVKYFGKNSQYITEEDLRNYIIKNNYNDGNYFRNFIGNTTEEDLCRSEFWMTISCLSCISEEFIEEFKDYLYWYGISNNKIYSQDFAKKYWSYLDKTIVSQFYNMSEEFMIENVEHLDSYYLNKNKDIPEDVKQRIINLKKVIDQ